MSRIADAFAHGKAFIPFITCGDPSLTATEQFVRAAVSNGADLIELGIPFSDPTAEGAVIQAANERALSFGVTTDDIFAMVKRLRKDLTVPLVFMTYANVVFSYGTERFLDRCLDTGIDGIILPDVPFEEKGDFAPACEARGIDFISLIAPTSGERAAMIAKEAKGFVYIVSSLGVTGVRSQITTDLEALCAIVRKHTDIPCAIGFGVSTTEQAKDMCRHADGVIVGSAIMKRIAEEKEEAAGTIAQYVRDMKQAIS